MMSVRLGHAFVLAAGCLVGVVGCNARNVIGEVGGQGGDGAEDAGPASGAGAGGLAILVDASGDVGQGGAGVGDASGGSPSVDAGCSITYPASGFDGMNIFYPGVTSFQSTVPIPSPYEFAADVPLGQTLSFTITLLGGSGGMPGVGPIWYFTDSDFRNTVYDATTGQQLFMSRLPGINEGKISFDGTGQARIDFFECGATAPTRTETITWAP